MIIIQGAQLNNERYIPLGTAIQRTLSFPLHVLVPEFGLDLALPGSLPLKKSVREVIVKASKVFPEGCEKILVGHSLGAAAAMLEASTYNDYAATIILGASVQRTFYTTGFKTPILTINGELDGLHRISRVAEAFFNLFTRKSLSLQSGLAVNPLVIIQGATHSQFADGVNPPLVLKKLDFVPKIPTPKIHAEISRVIADFLCTLDSSTCSGDISMSRLAKDLSRTEEFLKPMLKALELEAAPHLYRTCNSDRLPAHCPYYAAWPPEVPKYPRFPNETSECTCGIPWSSVAIQMMAGLDATKYPVVNNDAVHDVRDETPYHHAHLWTNCTEAAGATLPCVMNSTTVSERMYDVGDELDTGFTHATAYEIRVKMKSRQVFNLFSNDPKASLEAYDGAESICAKINKRAYDWALSAASPVALQRFKESGMPMVMGEDYFPPLPIGPLWIYNPLSLKETDVNGKKVLRVVSPSLKTPNEGFVTALYPDSNGYHYCKLLSPARVMEWIYTDGLLNKLGYK